MKSAVVAERRLSAASERRARASASDAVEVEDAVSRPIDRSLLLSSLHRHENRARYCLVLPWALGTYALCLATFVAHVQTEAAYELETACVAHFVHGKHRGTVCIFVLCRLETVLDSGDQGAFRSSSDVYAWLQGTIVPALYTSTASDASSPSAVASVNAYSHLVGGVRLSQHRSGEQACMDGAKFSALINVSCYPDTTSSVATFGDPDIAAAYNITTAFQPISIPEDWLSFASTSARSTFGPFELVLHSQDSEAAMAAKVQGLQAAGWLDAATIRVDVDVAVLNVEISRWARIVFSIVFTRGGRIDVTKTVRSISVDAYARSSLLALDVLVLIYFVTLVGGVVGEIYGAVRNVLRNHARGLYHAVRAQINVWLIIDVGAVCSLFACIIAGGITASTLKTLQNTVARAKWQPDTIEMDVIRAHAVLSAAIQDLADFKHAGSAALVFLTIKLFWQFSLQPRLAVLTEVIRRSISDILHFALVFSVIMAAFGVWGHVAFGSQLADWRTTTEASFSTIRLLMYDYDLPGMQRADPLAASVFFGAFMFLMTNLILWMFLAILLETYTILRQETQRAPSALEDVLSGIINFPSLVRMSLESWKQVFSRSRHPALDRPLVLDDGCAVDVTHRGTTSIELSSSGVQHGFGQELDSAAASKAGAAFAQAPAEHGGPPVLSTTLPSVAAIIDALSRPPLDIRDDVDVLEIAEQLKTDPRVVFKAVAAYTASSGGLHDSRIRALAGLLRNPRAVLHNSNPLAGFPPASSHERTSVGGAEEEHSPRGDDSGSAADTFPPLATPAKTVQPTSATRNGAVAADSGAERDMRDKLTRLLRVTEGLAHEMAELQASIDTMETLRTSPTNARPTTSGSKRTPAAAAADTPFDDWATS